MILKLQKDDKNFYSACLMSTVLMSSQKPSWKGNLNLFTWSETNISVKKERRRALHTKKTQLWGNLYTSRQKVNQNLCFRKKCKRGKNICLWKVGEQIWFNAGNKKSQFRGKCRGGEEAGGSGRWDYSWMCRHDFKRLNATFYWAILWVGIFISVKWR